MTDATNAVPEIRALLRRWAHAACVGDMDGVLADHSEDILMFDVPLPLQSRGLEAYRRTWEVFFASNQPGPLRFRLRDLRIAAGADVAVAYGLLDIGGEGAQCRLTVALRRTQEGWRIIHEHHSMPLG